MPYLLCVVDAPGFPRRTVIQSTLPPSHLRLSGQKPYGLLRFYLPYLPSPFIVSTRSAEYSYCLLIYLSYQLLSPANWRGVPRMETTDCQRRPPHQEAISNSAKSYPYIFRPISYRGDLPYAYRPYLPLPCTPRPLYIPTKRAPRR